MKGSYHRCRLWHWALYSELQLFLVLLDDYHLMQRDFFLSGEDNNSLLSTRTNIENVIRDSAVFAKW